ncbi:SLC13 family permease [Merdibacter massiliensis]|uniref:SLC13 family permease n=1 Tax=Merdibacter massiliensis TaxID=1871030 RepID=UPI00096A7260|nr:SLC13 family permease [Merdibacter massiliensis]
MQKHNVFHICMGPVLALLAFLFLHQLFDRQSAIAIATMLWMIDWWIFRPVNMSVTALLPIVINAIFPIVDMSVLLLSYVSSSIVLIFGTGLLSMSWENTGLDRRIALKVLSCIGPSIHSQILVWFSASAILSSFMPNVAVCALLCPIAISMFKSIGYDMHMRNDSINIVLLCIGWGAGIGGVGSPLGGAMNITAISYLNDFTQQEFMYIDWVIRMIPYLVIVMAVLSIVMIRIGKDCDPIKGSKAYFNELLQHLPPMHRDEKISLVLFVLAVVLAFVRPLYADFFIGLEPAYVFLIIGALLFFLRRENGQPFLTMKQVEKESLWGMMMLFGGGMALGTLVNESQAAGFIVDLFLNIPIHNMFLLVVIIFVIATLLSEVTNSTVCAAILTSIVLHTTSSMGFSPIPFWFGLCIAMNAEFLLPISVRAIPVSYGLDPGFMMKKGTKMVLIRLLIGIGYTYLCMSLFPGFGNLTI